MENLVPLALDLALKSSLILGLAWLITLLMRRGSAAGRHLVWTLAVLSVLALPALVYLLPGLTILPAGPALTWIEPSPEFETLVEREVDTPTPGVGSAIPSAYDPPSDATLPHGAGREAGSAASAFGGRDESPAEVGEATVGAPALLPATPDTAAPANDAEATVPPWGSVLLYWLPWIWLGGMSFALLPLVLGWLSLLHLRRTARPVTLGPWQRSLHELMQHMNLKRKVVLLKSPCRTMPMTWGAWPGAPANVLIPEDADDWSPDRQRAVLLHELAHVKRRDCLTQMLSQLACAIYWFNPLIWLAAHRMLIEREQACDDMVLLHETDSADYAQHLLEIATGPQAGVFAAHAGIAMARRSKLDGRLVAILDQHRNRRAMSRLGVALTITLIGAVAVSVAMLGSQEPSGALSATEDQQRREAFHRHTAIMREFERHYYAIYSESLHHASPQEVATALELEAPLELKRRGEEFQAVVDLPERYTRLILMFDSDRRLVGEAMEGISPAANSATWSQHLEAAEQRLIATLPGGVEVELLGVTRLPTGQHGWWQPDGSPLGTAPYETADRHRFAGYEVAVAMRGLQGEGAWSLDADQVHVATSDLRGRLKEDGQGTYASTHGLIIQARPGDPRSGTIAVRVASGGWEPSFSTTGENLVAARIEEIGEVELSEVRPVGGNQRLTATVPIVATSHRKRQWRLMAVGRDGQEHRLHEHAVSDFPTGHPDHQPRVRYEFELPMPVAELHAVHFQTRPFSKVEFRNVSLQPGHETEVQVVINPADAAPDAWNPPRDLDFLRHIPELRDVHLEMPEQAFQALVEERQLEASEEVRDGGASYWVTTEQGENVIVMFRNGVCSGIQRMPPEPGSSAAEREAVSNLPLAWGEAVEDLQVGLAVPERPLVVGEPFAVRWAIRNVGDEPRTIFWDELHYSPVLFEIGTPDGEKQLRSDSRRLLVDRRRRPAPSEPVVLAPGEVHEAVFDLSRFRLGIEEPGAYQVAGLYFPQSTEAGIPAEYLARPEFEAAMLERVASPIVQVRVEGEAQAPAGGPAAAQEDAAPARVAGHDVRARLHSVKRRWTSGEVPVLYPLVQQQGDDELLLFTVQGGRSRLEVDGMMYVHPRVRLTGVAYHRSKTYVEHMNGRGPRLVLNEQWRSVEGDRPLELTPGKHTVRYGWAGFYPQADDPTQPDQERPVVLWTDAVEIEIAGQEREGEDPAPEAAQR